MRPVLVTDPDELRFQNGVVVSVVQAAFGVVSADMREIWIEFSHSRDVVLHVRVVEITGTVEEDVEDLLGELDALFVGDDEMGNLSTEIHEDDTTWTSTVKKIGDPRLVRPFYRKPAWSPQMPHSIRSRAKSD
jgi:hypothetical protein